MNQRPAARPNPNERLVRVFDTEQESEALVVHGLLESTGIDSDITSIDASRTFSRESAAPLFWCAKRNLRPGAAGDRRISPGPGQRSRHAEIDISGLPPEEDQG